MFEAKSVGGEQGIFEIFFGVEHFGHGFVVADHIDFDVIANDAGRRDFGKEVCEFFCFFGVCGNFEFCFERGEAGRMLEGEGQFIGSGVQHLGMVQAKAAFIDHAALEVFHEGIVEVLVAQTFFEDRANAAERAIVSADEFLVDEHISDVIIHNRTPVWFFIYYIVELRESKVIFEKTGERIKKS